MLFLIELSQRAISRPLPDFTRIGVMTKCGRRWPCCGSFLMLIDLLCADSKTEDVGRT